MSLFRNVLLWIALAYAAAWVIVAKQAPDLWVIAALGFVQNVAFTFVSRGRNSGSLGYHLLAAIFSNGIYAALLFVSIDQVAQAEKSPIQFIAVYTLATLSGSIFAHWLALRLEKGKGKSVQEDKFTALRKEFAVLERHVQRIENEKADMANTVEYLRSIGTGTTTTAIVEDDDTYFLTAKGELDQEELIDILRKAMLLKQDEDQNDVDYLNSLISRASARCRVIRLERYSTRPMNGKSLLSVYAQS